MPKINFLVLIFITYILVLIQTTLFFSQPFFISILPTLILILVLIFLEPLTELTSFKTALAGGVFMDIYSQYPFGVYLFSLILFVLFFKFLKKNVAIF